MRYTVRLQPSGEERTIAADELRWGPGTPGQYLIHPGRTVSGKESREGHLPYIEDGPWCRLVVVIGQAHEEDVLHFDRSRLPRRGVANPGVETGESVPLALRRVGPGEERELGDLTAALNAGMGGVA